MLVPSPRTDGAASTLRPSGDDAGTPRCSQGEPMARDPADAARAVDVTQPAPPVPVLTARGITKVYGTGASAVHALRGVDLDLFAGEIVVLLGPSGSGKSTLFNI